MKELGGAVGLDTTLHHRQLSSPSDYRANETLSTRYVQGPLCPLIDNASL